MQLPGRWAVLLIVFATSSAAYRAVAARRHEAGSRDLETGVAADWAACRQAELEDRQFFETQWTATESELERLQQAADAFRRSGNSVLRSVALAQSLDPMEDAGMSGELELLKGMYADSKVRIAHLNAREAKSKAKSKEHEAFDSQRLSEINSLRVSGSLRQHELGEENYFGSYWKRVRARNLKQYHTCLNIQHNMMKQERTMMDMYERTLGGTAEGMAQVSNELGDGSASDAAFLQSTRRSTLIFCQEALATVQTARAELRLMADLSVAQG